MLTLGNSVRRQSEPALYLSESKFLRMLTLCGLYVAQGIPWGFVTITFAAWLAQPQHNLTTREIGPILAVASLPWSFKFVWGPLMDRFTIPWLGRRRPWILFAQGMAILVLASMLLVDDLPGMVWADVPHAGPLLQIVYSLVPGPLAAMILAANIFVSMQDVAVDALAVDLLNEEERGVANGLMYGSSYFGTAIGGSGLGYLVANYGIRSGLLGQVILLSLIMLLPLLIRERRASGRHSATGSRGDAARIRGDQLPVRENSVNTRDAERPADRGAQSAEGGPEQPSDVPAAPAAESIFANMAKVFRLQSALTGVVVALGVKIGIGVLTAVFVDYLQKQGSWTMEEYTTVTGGYAVLVGLIGAALGGYLADAVGSRPVIVTTSVFLGLLWIGFGAVPAALTSHTLVSLLLILQEFLLAVMSVSLFSLFMSISWPKVAATQFTTYMALMNLSTTIGSYTAGRLSETASIFQILILAGLLQAIMVVPVLFIDPQQTRRVLGDGT